VERTFKVPLSHAYPSTDQHSSKRPPIWAGGVFISIYLSKLQSGVSLCCG